MISPFAHLINLVLGKLSCLWIWLGPDVSLASYLWEISLPQLGQQRCWLTASRGGGQGEGQRAGISERLPQGAKQNCFKRALCFPYSKNRLTAPVSGFNPSVFGHLWLIHHSCSSHLQGCGLLQFCGYPAWGGAALAPSDFLSCSLMGDAAGGSRDLCGISFGCLPFPSLSFYCLPLVFLHGGRKRPWW